MKLIKIGDKWVDPEAVDAVQPRDGNGSYVELRGGGAIIIREVSCDTTAAVVNKARRLAGPIRGEGYL